MKKSRSKNKARPAFGSHIGQILRDKPKDQKDPLEYDRSVLQKARRERSSREQSKR